MAGTNGQGEERSKCTQALKEKDMEVQGTGDGTDLSPDLEVSEWQANQGNTPNLTVE